jgi:hypothetical protein
LLSSNDSAPLIDQPKSDRVRRPRCVLDGALRIVAKGEKENGPSL